LPAPPPPPPPLAPASKQRAPAVPYKPPRPDARPSVSQQKQHFAEQSRSQQWEDQWEDYEWSASGSAWYDNSMHGTSWSAGSWDRTAIVTHSAGSAYRYDAHRARGGGKGKSGAFGRGPQVATNMDASRLAW
jgi:hypothetical protein